MIESIARSYLSHFYVYLGIASIYVQYLCREPCHGVGGTVGIHCALYIQLGSGS